MPRRLPQGHAWDILQYEALRHKAQQHSGKILTARYAPSTIGWVFVLVGLLTGIVLVARWVHGSGILTHWPELVAAVAFVVVAFLAFRPRSRRARLRTRQARARRLR